MVQRIFIKGAVPSFYRPPLFPQPDISKCLMSLLDFFLFSFFSIYCTGVDEAQTDAWTGANVDDDDDA